MQVPAHMHTNKWNPKKKSQYTAIEKNRGERKWKRTKKKNVQDKEGEYNETLKYKEIPLENATYLK